MRTERKDEDITHELFKEEKGGGTGKGGGQGRGGGGGGEMALPTMPRAKLVERLRLQYGNAGPRMYLLKLMGVKGF